MNKRVGQKIRSLRESVNRTQESIADELNISRQKLARIENGQNDISFDFLYKYSKIIGVSVYSITSSLDEKGESTTAIRSSSNQIMSFDNINKMIDLFYANKDLYNSMKED